MESYEMGKRIAALRKQKGLTQQQLADRLNVTNRAVSRWETGEGYPEITLLPALCGALGSSADELLGMAEPIKKKYPLHDGFSLAASIVLIITAAMQGMTLILRWPLLAAALLTLSLFACLLTACRVLSQRLNAIQGVFLTILCFLPMSAVSGLFLPEMKLWGELCFTENTSFAQWLAWNFAVNFRSVGQLCAGMILTCLTYCLLNRKFYWKPADNVLIRFIHSAGWVCLCYLMGILALSLMIRPALSKAVLIEHFLKQASLVRMFTALTISMGFIIIWGRSPRQKQNWIIALTGAAGTILLIPEMKMVLRVAGTRRVIEEISKIMNWDAVIPEIVTTYPHMPWGVLLISCMAAGVFIADIRKSTVLKSENRPS